MTRSLLVGEARTAYWRANLRLVTARQNQQNRKRNANSKSGYKGVTAFRDRWQARIRVSGKEELLGVMQWLGAAPRRGVDGRRHRSRATLPLRGRGCRRVAQWSDSGKITAWQFQFRF